MLGLGRVIATEHAELRCARIDLPGERAADGGDVAAGVAVGAIIGGSCWADPALNTPDQIAQGKVYFDFDFSAAYPAEHITFRSHLVNDYLVEILKAA